MGKFETTVLKTASIRRALEAIDKYAKGVALVLDDNDRLIGVLTDGDIRRALLRGARLDDSIAPWISTDYVYVTESTDRASVLDIMRSRLIDQIPIIDQDKKVIGLHLLQDVIGLRERKNRAVIMAGGEGRRLRPITNNIPKPMVKVAGKPIIERLILHLISFGIKQIYIAVNYLAHVIEEYFEDGSRFGCSIKYIREQESLGTGGALSHLDSSNIEPLLVLNGDVVTDANIDKLIQFHEDGGYYLTMGLKSYRQEIPYGCVRAENGKISSLEEKPSFDYMINAGIYVVSNEALAKIPKRFFPMTELFTDSLENDRDCGAFLIGEDWTDIGQPRDLMRAQGTQL